MKTQTERENVMKMKLLTILAMAGLAAVAVHVPEIIGNGGDRPITSPQSPSFFPRF